MVLCASPDTVREIMIAADALNFNNGEYVFFNIDLFARFVALLGHRRYYYISREA